MAAKAARQKADTDQISAAVKKTEMSADTEIRKEDDTEKEASKIADKICGLRIFEDEAGKMNLAPDKVGAEMIIVSQFTLFADCRSRRPGFSLAARPETAIPLYEQVVRECRERGFQVQTGVFAAEMMVDSQNDGPVTILLDTNELS